MNRNAPALRSRFDSASQAARSIATKVAAGGTALMAPIAAFAATDPGSAITAEVTSAKTTVSGILVVLAGVVGLFILWSYLKRAK